MVVGEVVEMVGELVLILCGRTVSGDGGGKRSTKSAGRWDLRGHDNCCSGRNTNSGDNFGSGRIISNGDTLR